MKSESRVVEVVCAVLVDASDFVLAVQRPEGGALGGMWEFPGGKIESGECGPTALRRELFEELELDLAGLGKPLALAAVTHAYEFATIRLSAYFVRCGGRPRIELLEHADLRWLPLEEARLLPWAAADVPILDALAIMLEEHHRYGGPSPHDP